MQISYLYREKAVNMQYKRIENVINRDNLYSLAKNVYDLQMKLNGESDIRRCSIESFYLLA